jgi:signal transduction histidine kinase
MKVQFNKSSILGMSFIILLYCTINNIAYAIEPIVLSNRSEIKLIDSSNCRLINPITLAEEKLTTRNIRNSDYTKEYWYTFSVSNPSNSDVNFYLVSYNYSIDEIDLIKLDGTQTEIQQFRDTSNLYDRFIAHKQPVFNINLKPNEIAQYKIRIKNESSFYYEFAFYSPENFSSSFIFEYLVFGLFYGFMLYVLIYNLFYYSIFKERVILFYCIFLFSQIINMLFRDGTGLFLLPTLSEYSELIKNTARCSLGVFLLIYTYTYFKSSIPKFMGKWFVGIILFRIAYTIVMLDDTTFFTFHLEFGTFIFCTYWAVYSYIKGNSDAKYMTIGMVLLTSAYTLYYFSVVLWSSLSAVGFFTLYYGIAFESIFMTLALAERIKRIKIENSLTLQMNVRLEEVVKQRTIQIQEKNTELEQKSEELNLFLYSASHDLRGPLKTIEGLCNLGLKEDSEPLELFTLIKNKLSNLESNIDDLNTVTKIQNQDIPNVIIDFNQIHQYIYERFISNTGISNVNIVFNNKIEKPFISNKFAIKTIYQNIFENALKYKNPEKDLILKINIYEELNSIKIVFEDNGIGIPTKIISKIFNMFYRGNNESKNDTGLGLFIVKKAINKLGGTIEVSSEENHGATFTITLPR